MRVIKVESTTRLDGARHGPAPFFDLLNGTKESVVVDVGSSCGRKILAALVHSADVVIESSRPRALEQLGIDRGSVMKQGTVQVWLSISGYGRRGDAAMRIAFGDDAAVAGGLVGGNLHAPVFCADAIADPATGLRAAVAIAECLAAGVRSTIDVSLAGVAASLAYGDLVVPREPLAPPWARTPVAAAPRPGADTVVVLESLGITA